MSFDEQPGGDIHGECAAEIHRLEQEIKTERARCAIAEAKAKSIADHLLAGGIVFADEKINRECKTAEDWKLKAEMNEYNWRSCSDFANRRIGELRADLDACATYLKEGETPADALLRLTKELDAVRSELANAEDERKGQ